MNELLKEMSILISFNFISISQFLLRRTAVKVVGNMKTCYIIGFQFALYQNRFDHLLLDCLLENKPVVSKYDIILSSQTSATDVLKAMGAMPSGFRSTTPGKMAKEGKLLAISAPLAITAPLAISAPLLLLINRYSVRC